MVLADPGSKFSVIADGKLSIAAEAGIYVTAPWLVRITQLLRRIRGRRSMDNWQTLPED